MITVATQRLFLVRGVVDMRKSYDTLAAVVMNQLNADPMNGDGFIFVGRDRRRLKLLVWDTDGFWICMKRLERGLFPLPKPALPGASTETLQINHDMWASLTVGVLPLQRRHAYA